MRHVVANFIPKSLPGLMVSSTVPRNNVSYWIQNLDFGTCLSLADDFPLSRTKRSAALVARCKKGSAKTQEVIFIVLITPFN